MWTAQTPVFFSQLLLKYAAMMLMYVYIYRYRYNYKYTHFILLITKRKKKHTEKNHNDLLEAHVNGYF